MDFITLRSVVYQDLWIDLFINTDDAELESFVGLTSLKDASNTSGIQIIRIYDSIKTTVVKELDGEENSAKEGYLQTCDCVRLLHLESEGHLISRLNDDGAIMSPLNPLGAINRSLSVSKDISYGVFSRPKESQKPFGIQDFAINYDSCGVWRIIPTSAASENCLAGPLSNSSCVRFQHILSGQYLSMREMTEEDMKYRSQMQFSYLSAGKIDDPKARILTRNQSAEILFSDIYEGNLKSPYSGSMDYQRRSLAITKIVGSKIKVKSGKNIFIRLNFADVLNFTTSLQKSSEALVWFYDSEGEEINIPPPSSFPQSLSATLMEKTASFNDEIIMKGDTKISESLFSNQITSPLKAHDDPMVIHLNLTDGDKNDCGVLVLHLKPVELNRSHVPSPFAFSTGHRSRTNSNVPANEANEASTFDSQRYLPWIVATSSIADKSTLFTLERRDVNKTSNLEYHENLLIFHTSSKQYLSIPIGAGMKQLSNKWWEYARDINAMPTDGTVIDADVFRIEKVKRSEVQEILYSVRFVPLFRAAITSLQLTPNTDDLFIPLFKHFYLGIQSLIPWVIGQRATDGSLERQSEVPVTKSNKSGSGSIKLRMTLSRGTGSNSRDNHVGINSAMGPWVGRHVYKEHSLFNNSSFDKDDINISMSNAIENIDIDNATVSSKMNLRQNLLNETSLLVMLLHFVDVVYKSARFDKETPSSRNIDRVGSLPPIIGECCKGIFYLLKAAVLHNKKLALKVISINGLFLSLVSQLIIGWKPPIETIVTLVCDGDSKKQKEEQLILQHAISSQEIRQILEQMHFLHLHDNKSANNILDLLIMLCTAGAAQHFKKTIIDSIFSADRRRLVENSLSCPSPERTDSLGESDGFNDFSMLFHTRFSNGKWNFRFKSPFSFDSEEKDDNSAQLKLKYEAHCLKSLFDKYNLNREDGDTYLDFEESMCLLEDLGLGGKLLYDELVHLEGANFWSFICWWSSRFSFYNPTSLTSLFTVSPIHTLSLLQIPNAEELIAEKIVRSESVQFSMKTTNHSSQYRSEIRARVPAFNLCYINAHTPPHMLDFSSSAKSISPSSVQLNLINEASNEMPDHDNKVADLVWLSISDSLSPTWEDRNWFRKSLQLLEILCRDRNLVAQLIVSCIVPPDCILEALEDPNIDVLDKCIFINLLNALYVDHDFVFPTRLSPDSDRALVCGYSEGIFNKVDGYGKLFNELTVFTTSFNASFVSRTRLFEFMINEITRLDFASHSVDYVLFANAVVKTLSSLLCVGFFNEEDFDFMHAEKHHGISLGCDTNALVKGYVLIPEKSSKITLLQLEVLLIEKLESSLTHYAKIDSSHKSNYHRKSLNEIYSSFQKFDSIFANEQSISLNSHILKILRDIQLLKQMMKIQRVWDSICTTVAKSFKKRIPISSDSYNKINDIRTIFTESAAEDYRAANAILTLTLSNSFSIQRVCYDYFSERVNFLDGAFHLMDSFSFTDNDANSVIARCVDAFQRIVVKFASDISLSPRVARPFSLEKILFSVNEISKLCFRPLAASVGQDKSTNGADFWVQFLNDIHVPNIYGDDDLFDFDLEEFLTDTTQVGIMLSYFGMIQESTRIAEFIPTEAPTCDLQPLFFEFSGKLIEILSSNVNISNKVFWKNLHKSERFLLNTLLDFLSHIGSHSRFLLNSWFPNISTIVINYFPDCEGAVNLTKTFAANLEETEGLPFVETVLGKLNDRHLSSTVLFFSVLRAAAKNQHNPVREMAFTFFSLHAKTFLQEFEARGILSSLIDGKLELLEKNPGILYLLEVTKVICCSGSPLGSSDEVIRRIFSPNLCRQCLSSYSFPITIKPMIAAIALCLYRYRECPVELIIEDELKRMR